MKNLTPVEEGIIRGLILTDEQIGPVLKRVMEYGAELEAEIERLRAEVEAWTGRAGSEQQRAEQAEKRLAKVKIFLESRLGYYDHSGAMNATQLGLRDAYRAALAAAQPEEKP